MGSEKTTGRAYAAIDLKSFYASVECRERGLDPLTTNLVVADETRTDKTICLAVSPSLKAYGIPGRARLFEVKHTLARHKAQTGETVEFIIAPPQMQRYMDVSSYIYSIYLKYVSAGDIHVYSIDEVFIDLTAYLPLYKLTARGLVDRMIHDIYTQTGITATAGLGTNLYLAKIAMDIVAKHLEPDERGVRIAALTERSYRQTLWSHRPLTSFWRVGPGLARKLEGSGLYTMGDIARMSLLKNCRDPLSYKADYQPRRGDVTGEDYLFNLFGVDAELLIDHAWGQEPCTMAQIKAYRPASNSLGAGQVLGCGYPKAKGQLVIREMVDQLALDLVAKRLVTNQLVLDIAYDKEIPAGVDYRGPMVTDHYGRRTPKPAHGTVKLKSYTSSAQILTKAAAELYDRIVQEGLLVHKLNAAFGTVVDEARAAAESCEQLDLFTTPQDLQQQDEARERERKLQQTMLAIKGRFGKNAILKGMNLEEGATAQERNGQIGGHKA